MKNSITISSVYSTLKRQTLYSKVPVPKSLWVVPTPGYLIPV